MRKNSDLYNKIMEQVAKEVKRSLNEVDDIAPVKQEFSGEVYLVRCDGMNKKTLDMLTSKLPAFDNYGSGSIRVTCKTHEEVVKVVSLLVNSNVLDVDNSLGQSPRISIQKVNKNSVNDSVNENKQNIMKQYIQIDKIKTPRQRVKFEIIQKINNGELPATPEAIRAEIDKSGEWETRSEAQIQMDVNMILRRTSEFKDITSIEENSGDFITDFVYSPYNYDAGEFASPMAAAENHIKWLIKRGLDVRVEEGRYSLKYYIHYNKNYQYADLIQWLGWHMGFTESPSNRLTRDDKSYIETIVKSGKKTTFK